MAGAVGPASSAREAIERLVAVSFDTFIDDPQWTPLFMEFCLQATREAFARGIVARSMRDCRELFGAILRIGQAGGIVRSDLDVEAAATLLIAVFDGTALQWLIDPEGVDMDRLQQPMADLIERFVTVKGAADMGGLQEPLAALFARFTKDTTSSVSGTS